MSTPLLEVSNATRFFGETVAVRDLNFTLKQGEVIGLLGLNGAGKSTTLRMLSGTLAPSLGEVLLLGENIQQSPQVSNAFIGYLPETPPLYLQQRVDTYLTHCAQLYGLAATDIESRCKMVKQQCGLEKVGQRIIGNLSKGFQQRIGIAQAIIHEPKIIILDEPTVGLDPQQLLNIRTLVKTLTQNAAVIFSSHMLSEVSAIADRVIIMHHGQIVHDAMNLQAAPKLEALFADVIFGKSSANNLHQGHEVIT